MNPNNHLTIRSAVINRRMLVALAMGFSCGLPLLLTLSVLQAWMKEEGVDLTVIGLTALVGLPYTLKFLWAPLFDRFTLPFVVGGIKPACYFHRKLLVLHQLF